MRVKTNEPDVALYGVCPVHLAGRGTRFIEEDDGSARLEMFCPACDASEDWDLAALVGR